VTSQSNASRISGMSLQSSLPNSIKTDCWICREFYITIETLIIDIIILPYAATKSSNIFSFTAVLYMPDIRRITNYLVFSAGNNNRLRFIA
jgi:hypothetical protein